MSQREPFVVAVVLNWKGWADTIACLESMLRLDYPADRLGIVVCDNGSDDESIHRIRAWADGAAVVAIDAPAALRGLVDPPVPKPVRYSIVAESALESDSAPKVASGLTLVTLKTNRGFAGGNNAVLRYLFPQRHVDCIWLVNNDIVVDRGSLRALVDALEERPTATALGGMLFDFQDPDRLQEAGCAFHMWQGMASPVTQPDDTEHTRLNYLSGGFLLASRELLVRAGLLAEDYFMYCEDVDYSRRLERAGATLRLVSSARAWHKGGASSRYRSATHDYYVVRNGLQVVRRFSPLTLPSAMVYLAVRCGAPKVWRGEWSRLAVMARAYRDFFTGRMGRAGVLPGESGG